MLYLQIIQKRHYRKMRHLIINNFGPLTSADLNLRKMNLIIGLQGSGKSCVMMTACHCAWVEKRIALRQSAKEFESDSSFVDSMLNYYRAKGYLHDDTYIEYETDFMKFSYDQKTRHFSHQWKESRWKYRRPKVSYVPAERNMVSLVSNWSRLETSYDSILDFKADWDTARRYVKSADNILGTGISYKYDEHSDTDAVITSNGRQIEMTSSSSGMQSLVPQFVHLTYLSKGIYKTELSVKERTYAEKQFAGNLLNNLYKQMYDEWKPTNKSSEQFVIHIEGLDFMFYDKKMSDKFYEQANRFLCTDHAEVFLEEPESNLFPPTQIQLMNWILEIMNDKKRKNFIVIATHSPYVLSHLLQENIKDFGLYLTYPVGDGYFSVKTADNDDIQGIYDNGSDAFFNFEAFTEQ